MAAPAQGEDSDDGMDEFMEKFKTQKYKNAFNESNWEEEFNNVPMFMKTAPENIDPEKNPDLACIQSIIHDDDRTPEEQARSLKDEGNDYFKEKNYKKSVVSYTEGLKKNCMDLELNAILYTNRAAAHFYLGNMRSALNDATVAKKLKPDHIKAIIRGAQCSKELHNYNGALQWCDEGLKLVPTDKKLLELRATADKLKVEMRLPKHTAPMSQSYHKTFPIQSDRDVTNNVSTVPAHECSRLLINTSPKALLAHHKVITKRSPFIAIGTSHMKQPATFEHRTRRQ
ncbi:tetratricopeptide repeat protein [Pimephales promelas]|nr:tetratricopeptide repeat protein [Pimephales promelas]